MERYKSGVARVIHIAGLPVPSEEKCLIVFIRDSMEHALNIYTENGWLKEDKNWFKLPVQRITNIVIESEYELRQYNFGSNMEKSSLLSAVLASLNRGKFTQNARYLVVEYIADEDIGKPVEERAVQYMVFACERMRHRLHRIKRYFDERPTRKRRNV